MGRLNDGKGRIMGHTYSNLLFHTIFGTKDRRPLIAEESRQRLYEYMAGIARNEFGRALVIGGVEDHVHGLLSLRTDVPIAEAMRKWKSLSSGWVHKTFPQQQAFAWQSGYAAFSVSHSMTGRVTRYINEQQAHHRKRTFEEEFMAFLDAHGVEYDPKNVWDSRIGC